MRALRNSHCRTYWTAACTALALVACFLVLPAWAAPRCKGMAATIVGTSGADTIKGTSGTTPLTGSVVTIAFAAAEATTRSSERTEVT